MTTARDIILITLAGTLAIKLTNDKIRRSQYAPAYRDRNRRMDLLVTAAEQGTRIAEACAVPDPAILGHILGIELVAVVTGETPTPVTDTDWTLLAGLGGDAMQDQQQRETTASQQ